MDKRPPDLFQSPCEGDPRRSHIRNAGKTHGGQTLATAPNQIIIIKIDVKLARSLGAQKNI